MWGNKKSNGGKVIIIVTCEKVIFIKPQFRHASSNTSQRPALFFPLWHTNTIAPFTAPDFGSGHSRPAFISICLDTIYYQLLIPVLSTSFFLFVGSFVLDFRRTLAVRREARVNESCLPPSSSSCGCRFSCLSSKRKSVCLPRLSLNPSSRFLRVVCAHVLESV